MLAVYQVCCHWIRLFFLCRKKRNHPFDTGAGFAARCNIPCSFLLSGNTTRQSTLYFCQTFTSPSPDLTPYIG